MHKTRAFTESECRDKLLACIWSYINYWENESRAETSRKKLEGLAFGILVILDGGSSELPGFEVIPSPHPSDEEYHRNRGENWWPNGLDLGGSLHELFHQAKPKE